MPVTHGVTSSSLVRTAILNLIFYKVLESIDFRTLFFKFYSLFILPYTPMYQFFTPGSTKYLLVNFTGIRTEPLLYLAEACFSFHFSPSRYSFLKMLTQRMNIDNISGPKIIPIKPNKESPIKTPKIVIKGCVFANLFCKINRIRLSVLVVIMIE